MRESGIRPLTAVEAMALGIDWGRMTRLDAAVSIDPLRLHDACPGVCVGAPIHTSDSGEVHVWQTVLPDGEHYLPPLSCHVLSMCLADVPWGAWCLGTQAHVGPIPAGTLLLAHAHGRAAYVRSAHPVRLLHVGFAVGVRGIPARLRHQPMLALQDPALRLLLKALQPPLHANSGMPQLFIGAVAQAVRAHLVEQTARPVSGSELFGMRLGPQAGLSDEQLSQVTAFLIPRMAQPSEAMAELAAAFGVNERTLSRHLQQRTGQTLVMYFLHLRLSQAYEMLQAGQLSVTAVAQTTGFADLPHFSRHFRKHYGVPPSAVLVREGARSW